MGALELLAGEAFAGILAIVDADFCRIDGAQEEHECVVYSEYHDHDLDWAQPEVLGRYLREVADDAKVSAHGGSEAVIGKVLECVKVVSVARFLNYRGLIKYRLARIDVSPIVHGFSLSVHEYVAAVVEDASRHKERSALEKLLNAHLVSEWDLLQLTNGHDFFAALGACLRDELGNRRLPQSWGNEVALHIRLAFGDADFVRTAAFRGIRTWESQNKPYVILDQRLPHLT